jgi:hypothetical protein
MIIGLDKAMKSFGFYMHGITEIEGMETELKTFFHQDRKYSYFREGIYAGHYVDGSPIAEEEFDSAFSIEQNKYYDSL